MFHAVKLFLQFFFSARKKSVSTDAVELPKNRQFASCFFTRQSPHNNLKRPFCPTKMASKNITCFIGHYKRHIRVHVYTNNASFLFFSLSLIALRFMRKCERTKMFFECVRFFLPPQAAAHLNEPQPEGWKSLSIRTYYSTLIKEILLGRRSWNKAQSIELI